MSHLHDVMPSVGARLGLPDLIDTLGLPDAQRYIVLLVDGLGWINLMDYAQHAPFLAAHADAPLTADFPTTTSVGLAALGTGLATGQHGIVGASFWLPETESIFAPLHWPDSVPAHQVQPEPTIFERLVHVGVPSGYVASAQYRDTGLTRATLRGAVFRAAEQGAALVHETAAHEWPCTFVYWSELDRIGHGRGVGSSRWIAELERVDALARDLHRACPHAVLLVTADHGMVNAAQRFDLNDQAILSSNVRAVAGEPRMRHVYLTDPTDERTLATWQEIVGPYADVRSKAAAQELFGPTTPDSLDRIGDLVCVANPGWLLTCRFDARLGKLPGQHGGTTEEESLIPGLVIAT